MPFIKYVVFCKPMGLVSSLVLMLGLILLVRLLFLHCISSRVKKSPLNLKNHRVALLLCLSFIIVGLIGIFITVKHGNEEITEGQYQHLIYESKVFPYVKASVSGHIKKHQHINQIKYCNLMHEIERDKISKVKTVIEKW